MATRDPSYRGKGKSGNSRGGVYKSKRPVGGNGIFITCIRGKESRALIEIMDLLDECADELYPADRLAYLTSLIPVYKGPVDDTAAGEEEEVDAEAPTEVEPAKMEESSESEPEDQSIEASIARELAELKNIRNGGTGKLGRRAKQTVKKNVARADEMSGVRRKIERPRFEALDTSTECLLFISVQKPYDPVEMVEKIVTDLKASGVSRTRFVQKLSPTIVSALSTDLDRVTSISAQMIRSVFYAYATKHQNATITYQIEPSLRAPVGTLSRSTIVELLGSLVTALSQPDPANPEIGVLNVSANLTSPNLVILASVLRKVYTLSIVDGALWTGKKFNLASLGDEGRVAKEAREGATTLRGMEVEPAVLGTMVVEGEKPDVEME